MEQDKNFKLFDTMLTEMFNNKRKKIKKSIKKININKTIVNENIRPTNLSLNEFINIYNEIEKKEECK